MIARPEDYDHEHEQIVKRVTEKIHVYPNPKKDRWILEWINLIIIIK